MFQIILLNNYDDEGIRVTGGRGITVTGLSQGVDLFTRKTLTNTISLTTDDVKPTQHIKNVKLDNGQVADSADVFAVRMLTWGLPKADILELSSKAGSKAEMIDDNYVGIGLALRNGGTFTITRNITDILHNEKPAGGIVTIYIDSSQIPNSAFEKPKPSGGGGFNANVEYWADEVNAEVII